VVDDDAINASRLAGTAADLSRAINVDCAESEHLVPVSIEVNSQERTPAVINDGVVALIRRRTASNLYGPRHLAEATDPAKAD
jgi:hypothetical protein